MKILAIESTAHTIGVAIIESKAKSATAVSKANTKVLSNEIARYPAKLEGFIPRKLADHHAKEYPRVLRAALSKAKVALADIDYFSYSQGPGIGHCLRVGFVGARSLSLLNGKPLIPVNHTVAHVEVGKWACGCADPLVVYVSGGNTQILAKHVERGANYYHVFGETLDVGIGNFLDVMGRELALSPPNAIGFLALAEKGKEFLQLPYTVKGNNLAFSGLQSAALRLKGKHPSADICFSASEVAFSTLVEATERVLCHTGNKEMLIVGGVAQAKRLQQMYSLMAADHGVRFSVVPPVYAGDQAAMIGITAVKHALSKDIRRDVSPNQSMRIDSHAIRW
jgi:N6-L-threonylcarbamoyladenine synthase